MSVIRAMYEDVTTKVRLNGRVTLSRANAGKTKVMRCRVNRFQMENSGKYTCGVCRKRVCHNLYSVLSGFMRDVVAFQSNVIFHCRGCLQEVPVKSESMREVEIEPNVKLECVPKFCYFGDTLGVGGVEEAARAKVRCAWAKFKELSPI